MTTRGTIRLATRGSSLALRQADAVRSALEDRRYTVELVEVETDGDRLDDDLISRLGTTGAFVRALDERVLDGEVDAAVHSMKDMPTESPEELIVAGVPERASAGDVLVTPDGRSLEDLPDAATVGTASLRRRAQLLAARPDLRVEPVRGNVDTRIEKLLAPTLQRDLERRRAAEDDTGDDEEAADDEFDRPVEQWRAELSPLAQRALDRETETAYDALVLAAAGLDRLDLGEVVGAVSLDRQSFVPAPGQGAIAVTALDETDASEAIHAAIDHPRTRVETTAERVILATLGGGCVAPIGVHAVIRGEHVHVVAQVLDGDGEETVQAARDLPVRTYVEAARSFAADLDERGAGDLLEAARRADGPTRRR